MSIKSASLSLILEAAGKKTGDQLIKEREEEEKKKMESFYSRTGIYLNSRKRRNLSRMYAKNGLTFTFN